MKLLAPIINDEDVVNKKYVDTTADKLQSQVDNIQIGGRNLLYYSRFDNKYADYWYYPPSVTYSFDSGYTTMTKPETAARQFTTQASNKNLNLLPENGCSYTLSCEVMKAEGLNVGYGTKVTVRYNYTDGTVKDFDINIPSDITEDVWHKCSYAFTYSSGKTINYTQFIVALGAEACGIKIKNVKFEKGNKATDWTPAPEDVDNNIAAAIDAVEIGGRNIVTGTATMTIGTGGRSVGHWRKSGTGTIETIDITDTPLPGINKGIKITSSEAGSQIGIAQDKTPLNSSSIYTLSCWVRSNAVSGLECRLQPFYLSASDYGGNGAFNITNQWQHISYTTINNPKNTTEYSASYIYLIPQSEGDILEICGIKLEVGNKATDWTPAPEDIDNNITDATNDFIKELSVSKRTITYTKGDGSTGTITTQDTITTATTTGSGNAVTAITANDKGALTVTKGATFLTAHPTIATSMDSTSTASPSAGDTFTAIDAVTKDSNGHVTKVNTKTITLPAKQTTISGNAGSATKLATARTIQINLESTSSASFDGTANITPGVTGTLPISNGGTGQTTAKAAANSFINALETGSDTPQDTDYYVSQYAGGGTTNTSYVRRTMSALWNYIKSKLATVATSGSYNDLSNKPTIPTVGNGTITIKQAGTTKGTFTTNQDGNTTIELTDNNTDTKVTQIVTTSNANYPLLLAPSGQTTTTTTSSYFGTDLIFNPSTKTLKTKQFEGNLAGSAVRRYVYGEDNNVTTNYGYYKIASFTIDSPYYTAVLKLRIWSDNFTNFARTPAEVTIVFRTNSTTATTTNAYTYVDGEIIAPLLNSIYLKYPNTTNAGTCELYFYKDATYQKIDVDVLYEGIRGSTPSTYQYQSVWTFSDNKVISNDIAEDGYAVATLNALKQHQAIKASTFTGIHNYEGNNGAWGLNIIRTDFTKGDIPTYNTYWALNFMDKNSGNSHANRIGYLDSYIDTSGNSYIELCAMNNVLNDTTGAVIRFGKKRDGTEYLRLGSSTIGSSDSPVYINGGIITSTGKKFSNYLPLAGGTMSDTIISSKTTNSYLKGNQGEAIINSTAGAGSYTMLAKTNSANGYFTTGSYQTKYLLQYTEKATVDAGTNAVTKSVTLLDESGNSSFPGTVSATTFSGALSGNASSATYSTNVRVTDTNPTTGAWYYPVWADNKLADTNYKLKANDGLCMYSLNGTTSTVGRTYLSIGNSTASGTAGNKKGYLRLYSESSSYTDILATTSSDNYKVVLPDSNGTIALRTECVEGVIGGNSLTLSYITGSKKVLLIGISTDMSTSCAVTHTISNSMTAVSNKTLLSFGEDSLKYSISTKGDITLTNVGSASYGSKYVAIYFK